MKIKLKVLPPNQGQRRRRMNIRFWPRRSIGWSEKRRLMKGAQTTAEDFDGMFTKYFRLNSVCLREDLRGVPDRTE